MTEAPEFSGSPEMFTREDCNSLTAAEVANELMWIVAELVDRINT